ncbi:MAG: hypothetical protein A3J81_03850 [Nitrospirae bacterium RIFOXYB2_FULL_43_5]|nr:MAG: hypothetical protein A2X54_09635 [Nitrospirae bacterium GWF2_44_13]OGW63478.1 MAG: hypothetical protein A2222_06585 [Nitrospirae bacterium RIFOXYA2_FULL_44_9]OGW71360.1 MAG: hypothetical protein A2484_02840 [Nitrospirae bacterium RIFOXYC2_FULL_44_7]OGW80062.1 MAG: hypothetical protein A3J81_03850 [Nitrospirae bacterium RIFOXYB2_FULL_43_5]HBG92489.1 hypothetical protein [Nitrospiraceae bacterium]
MEKKELIKRYTEMHGNVLGQREDLYVKVASLIKEMDYIGITDRYEREVKKLSLIEKEIGNSKDLDTLKSLAASLFQPKARQTDGKVE